MDIKLLDSWLREFLKTQASPKKIAEVLSLTSVSVERLEKHGSDCLYDIEVTTNRPDLTSVIGLAREAAAVLPEFGIHAEFIPPFYSSSEPRTTKTPLTIINYPKLVRRICAVVLEVHVKQSPRLLKERLEAAGIRSLNNIIDITNYVMREIGHPTHIMDYDLIKTHTIRIRESRRGERINALNGKEFELSGGDIVADDGLPAGRQDTERIIDLIGIMGLSNSVVTDNTKRIVYFINNDEPSHIRKTSMELSLRTEAAILNEKGLDPHLAYDALLRGIELFKEFADAKVVSDIIDIYPQKMKSRSITIPIEKINRIMGVEIPIKKSQQILERLGFQTATNDRSLTANVPSFRNNDVQIEEDLIEEIARVYGYHRLPSVLPPSNSKTTFNIAANEFYWENRAKAALKYWGFTESYTYSMVAEELLEGPPSEAVTIQNPLNSDMVYMRRTLMPSLLQLAKQNSNKDEIKIFEIANVYIKKSNSLPDEVLMLASIVKKPSVTFYKVKGIVEQLLSNIGIQDIEFKKRRVGDGAGVFIKNSYIGDIEILEDDLINFEFNFETIVKQATLKKVYHPIPKFPPVIEDVSIVVDPSITYAKIVSLIRQQSNLVYDVQLLDTYKDKKTFRITYQDAKKNLTNEEVAKIREKIYQTLEKTLGAKIV